MLSLSVSPYSVLHLHVTGLCSVYSNIYSSFQLSNPIVEPVNLCAATTCPVGSICKVDRGSGKAFCEPSCKIKNGGCKIDEECTLKTVECFTTPCPPEIVCVPKGILMNNNC